ncbi:MAG: RNA methyltransferase [Bacteroidales bacterium]|jgi:TrmH family RNA methyltransferase|nr:RNA methyltransferase [Bacteroidales bacterium]HNT41475.1 RNA methyltransferase [Tenuifilaceae bacterium]MBP8643719.1 RNA methyltransferase [Bacteroidales bacterium]NLI86881.1 RNA methyltransferase [Bacteroidales bacterium]HPH00463.1 RNA methyltransferase [Tenuifilaceae bacterium]
MLTRRNIQRIVSLRQKKHRNELGLFVAEGQRLVSELLKSHLDVAEIYHTGNLEKMFTVDSKIATTLVSENEMNRISALSTPTPVLALVKMPLYNAEPINHANQLVLALDSIQDPGNMGTILRLADWFGIDTILCSNDTADIFSPKVVQASMGAIARIKVHYCNLPTKLSAYSKNSPIFGTYLEGESIYDLPGVESGCIVMGNEGNGISPEVGSCITQKIHIPDFAGGRARVESLNVAMATAIVLSEFRRKQVALINHET